MKKILLASVATIALIATPAFSQISKSDATDDDAIVGGTAGAAAGGTLGFFVGGPIGAIVGGFAGAVLGAEAAVPEQTIVYAGNHPVQPVYVDGSWDVGAIVPASVTVYPVEPTPEYGYVYANNRVYIVDNASREIVYSPGYTVSQDAVAYAEANPTPDISISGAISAGDTLDGAINVSTIPDYPHYSYVYVNGKPAVIETNSRTIIWVG